MNTRKLTRFAIITALYIIFTNMVPALSYGPFQFRFSEIMTLLAFIDPFYVMPLTLGCAIANIWSPFGIFDVIFGTLATYLALKSMTKVKNIYVASIFPSIFSVIIGLEIYFLSTEPINFFLVTAQILFSQFIIVSVIGVSLFKVIMKNDYVMGILKDTNFEDKNIIN